MPIPIATTLAVIAVNVALCAGLVAATVCSFLQFMILIVDDEEARSPN